VLTNDLVVTASGIRMQLQHQDRAVRRKQLDVGIAKSFCQRELGFIWVRPEVRRDLLEHRDHPPEAALDRCDEEIALGREQAEYVWLRDADPAGDIGHRRAM